MGVKMICCGMTVKRTGMLGVMARKRKALNVKMETVTLIEDGNVRSVRKTKALTVKMQTVTLIGKGR
jgi:hypothetical protein